LFGQASSDEKATPGVRWMAYEGLARLATAKGHTAEAARQFESALAIVEQTRSSLLRADDRISFTARLLAFYRGYTELLLAGGQVERALEVADASRGRVLAERQGVAAPAARATAASLQQLARQTGTTLVFYWLGAEKSWVWTVTDRSIHATALPAAPAIEALVTEYHTAIQSALVDPLAAASGPGDRLYKLLIQPIAEATAARNGVIIVPDGALHRLNFETLPVPGPAAGRPLPGAEGPQARPVGRHYWIEDVTVQIAPSLAMLQAATRPRSSPSLLLVGNAAPRLPEFPALSYAAAEMSGVRQHFPAASVAVIDGEAASPAAFKAAAPGRFSVIHFTSHAIANPESPLDSAVILSGPDQAFKLYAREVASLPLAADLVTVSACRSAGERAYAGEGLVGFAWAFLRAGSRRVVAGLWDVDDRSTAVLMEQVYARMAGGAPPAVALREAKRALMRGGYPQPYYWAPFQMFTLVV
jgi:CHAT domain-containing protein